MLTAEHQKQFGLVKKLEQQEMLQRKLKHYLMEKTILTLLNLLV